MKKERGVMTAAKILGRQGDGSQTTMEELSFQR